MNNNYFKTLILLFAFILFFLSKNLISQTDHWIKQNPPLTGSELIDVYFVNEQLGWIVGQNGVILHTRDKGKSWHFQETPVYSPPRLYSVCFVDSVHGWAAGGVLGYSYILKTNNGGETWTEADMTNPEAYVTKIYFTNKDTGYILLASPSDNLWITMDAGQTWAQHTIPNSGLFDICCINDSIAVICGGNGYMAKTTDAGMSWHPSDINETSLIYKVQMFDEMIGYAIQFSGKIYKTVDGARSWQTVLEARGIQFNAIHIFNAETMIVVGSYNPNYVIKTTDGGKTWRFIDTGINPQIRNWYFINDDFGYGVTWYGSIIKISDRGETYKEITEETGGHIYSLAFCDKYNGLATTEDGCILKTSNGTDWDEIQSPAPHMIKNSLMQSENRFAVISFDSIFTTVDNGESWEIQALDQVVLKGGFISNTGKMYILTNQNQLWQSNGFNENFRFISTIDAEHNITDIHFIDLTIVYSIDSHGNIFKSNDGGLNWDHLAKQENLISKTIYFSNENTGWLGGSKKTGMNSPNRQPVFYNTTDGGQTWSIQDHIIFLEENSIPHDISKKENGYIFDIQSADGQILYALNESYVFCSDDLGKTWRQQAMDFYSGNYLTSLYVLNNENIWAAGNSRFIWKKSGNGFNTVKECINNVDNANFKIYPNPFNSRINFLFDTSNISPGSNSYLRIYNINGQIIFKDKLSLHSGQNKYSWIPQSHLSSGVYFVRISTPSQIFIDTLFYLK